MLHLTRTIFRRSRITAIAALMVTTFAGNAMGTTSRLSCEKWGVALPATDGRLELRIVVDNCSIDVHAGAAGLFYMPMFFGPLPSKERELRCEGGSVTLHRLRVHTLKPIWNQEKPS